MTTSGKQVPWLRVLAEGGTIVVSILLAFGIEAWWSARQEADRRDRFLTTLEVEFEQNVDLIDGRLSSSADFQDRVERFLALDPDATGEVPTDSAALMLQALWRPGTSDLNNGVLLALLDSESFGLIDDPSLQRAIAEWTTLVSGLSARRDMLLDLEVQGERTLGRLSAVRPVIGWIASGSEVPTSSVDGLRQALRDPEVMALAATKALHLRLYLSALGQLRELDTSVLPLVRAAK